jgi:XapX domain-containing protein
MIREVFLSILTGGIAGVIFALFKLPVPAPPVFAGVAGIVGLWAGYSIINNVLN